jgi:hypothetical protein
MKIDIKSLPANSVRIRTAAKRCALHGDCVAVVPVSIFGGLTQRGKTSLA